MHKGTSLIIPHFNEATTVKAVVQAGLSSGVGELIVVDDGSRPALRKVIARLSKLKDVKVVICSANRGDGTARKVGVAYATGNILGFCDADLAMVSADALKRLFGKVVAKEADLVIGTFRYADGSDPRLTTFLVMPLLRQFTPELARRVSFPLSGVRVIRRSFLRLERIEPRMCMLGMTLDAWRAGARISEIDIGVIENPKRPIAEKAARADLILKAALRRFEEWGLIEINQQ